MYTALYVMLIASLIILAIACRIRKHDWKLWEVRFYIVLGTFLFTCGDTLLHIPILASGDFARSGQEVEAVLWIVFRGSVMFGCFTWLTLKEMRQERTLK